MGPGFIENLIARVWNKSVSTQSQGQPTRGLYLGHLVRDGVLTRERVILPDAKRPEHVTNLGKTGTGKTTLIHNCQAQDIDRRHGFAAYDHHGPTTPFVLGAIAAEEQRTGRDLSERTILIDPTDPTYSVGLNILERTSDQEGFLQRAELAAILRQRWGLDSLGPRTEELLRNALHAVADNDLTLLEVSPFLSSAGFRARCLRRVTNPEVRAYFEGRYNAASSGMQAAMSGPVLNKLTAFTADPHFRHIFGQQRSTFSLIDAMDKGHWIILDLEKGKLGEEAQTAGTLFLKKLLRTLFRRRSRRLFTIYADEIQNLVTQDSGLEVLLSEARKFAVGVVSANQFLDQFPTKVRAAVLAVGTHICFQLSSSDANQMATALDGGKTLAELLRNLPQRQFVLKSGNRPWMRVQAPDVSAPKIDFSDLRRRSLERWARKREDVEREIRSRQAYASQSDAEVLRDWE